MKNRNIYIQVITILTSILCLGFSSQASARSLSDTLRIESGLISGMKDTKSEVVSFKGIPFAAPPVGDLRWKAPQSVKSWNGVKICKMFSASAMQATPMPFSMWTAEFIAPAEPLSEDCLYLNVWTAAKSSAEKRPVIVFIHGGAFTSGSGSVPVYDGTAMAQKGVVFVTINYRVGIFGFFSHPELSKESETKTSGNYGLLDQIEALKWVQKNIAAFGGDPGRVTIAGQSAGAFSVNYLVASPLAKGLFQRAIAESGGAVLPTNPFAGTQNLKDAEQHGIEFASSMKVNSLAELRAKTSTELMAVRAMTSPIVDGYVIPEPLFLIFSGGKQNDVPVLMGWNANEGNFGGQLLNGEKFKKQAKENFGEKADEFLKLFPSETDAETEQSQLILSGLQTFGVQAYAWMNLQNKTGKSSVFMYHFERAVPFGKDQKPFGAFHTGEVPYAYNNLHMSNRPWEKTDYQLAETMSSYWANFAANGNPNGTNLPKWTPCSPENLKAMILAEKVEIKELPQRNGLNFLEQFYISKLKKD
ncbi:MAG TPA: carboxylesterase family protein [Prolixibacteraceae bacterium]|jgi:para-nitrobenzyl esterase